MIAGDIKINLLDIELLTIKLRLVVASVDKAKEMGIDWWESDPAPVLARPARRTHPGERGAPRTPAGSWTRAAYRGGAGERGPESRAQGRRR